MAPKNDSRDADSQKDKELMFGFMKEVMGKTEPPLPSPSLPLKPNGTGSHMVEQPILNEGPKQENATEGRPTSHVTKIGDTWHYTSPDKGDESSNLTKEVRSQAFDHQDKDVYIKSYNKNDGSTFTFFDMDFVILNT